MNNTYNQRPRTSRRSHASGLMLLFLATVLAIVVVVVLDEWSKDPGTPGQLFARLMGGPGFSLGISGNGSETPQAPEGADGVPRSRSGLVPTSSNRGQILFGRYCDSCHTAGREMIGPSLRTVQFKSQYKTADKIVEFVRTGGFDMPAYPPTLVSDDELQKIAEYILSLPEESP